MRIDCPQISIVGTEQGTLVVSFFSEIKQYVGFDQPQSERLIEFSPLARPHIPKIVRHFYECIEDHPQAKSVIKGGEEQSQRLRETLRLWMESALDGPHDEDYYERRARIGRVHVQIGLPQQYVFTAMNVIRIDFHGIIDHVYADDWPTAVATRGAIDRLFDLELAIMLQTYLEDSEAQLRRQERLATIGQLAASIGHDLRNPLGVIESSLYIVRRNANLDQKTVNHLNKISDQVRSCNRIVTDLLEMARRRAPVLERFDIAALLREAAESIGLPDQIKVVYDVQAGMHLRAERGLLLQCITNLIVNAYQALDKKSGKIVLRAQMVTGEAHIEVVDNGPGFSLEILRTAFEPLVTTRHSGVGLGLALVRSVIERHGGQVEAENTAPGGACVRLRFPDIVERSVDDGGGDQSTTNLDH